jgi:tetratricopeptide (TPR) repeat protein
MEDLGHTEKAREYYEKCLLANLPDEIYDDTLQRLSLLQKRNNNYAAAIPLWEQAVLRKQVYAYEELAKYYEHHALNLEMARKWTLEALEYISSGRLSAFEWSQWTAPFQHRLERLERKISIRSE